MHDSNNDPPAAENEAALPLSEASERMVSGPLGPNLARFGMPLVVAMGLQATFNLVDMVVVGHLVPEGTAALSALIICDLVAMIATIFGNGISNASVAIIARRDAEGNKHAVAMTTAQSLSLTVIVSLAFGVVGIALAGPITGDVMGAKGVVHAYATDYMRVIVGGGFSILVLLQLVSILRAVGDSRTPMFLLVGSNVLNLFLSVVMVYGPGEAPDIFGWGPPVAEALGIERGGVVGAAWSTVISRTIAIVLGFIVLARHKGGLKFPLSYLWPIKKEFSRIWHIAWPNSAQYVVRVGIMMFFAGIVGHNFTSIDVSTGVVDSSVSAAFAICVRLDSIALFTGMGWGAAASTFIGQNLGANKPERAIRAGWICCGYNAVLMMVVLVVFLAFGREILSLFIMNQPVDVREAVVDAGIDYLWIVGSTYAFLGLGVVLSSALSGAGATRSSLVIDVIVLLGIVIPTTLVWLSVSDLSQTATWSLIAAGNVLTAVGYAIWFARKTWIHKEI